MVFKVATDHPQVAGFGYLVANLATLLQRSPAHKQETNGSSDLWWLVMVTGECKYTKSRRGD